MLIFSRAIFKDTFSGFRESDRIAGESYQLVYFIDSHQCYPFGGKIYLSLYWTAYVGGGQKVLPI